MSDLISREEAIQIIRSQGLYGSGYSDEERENNVIDMLESVPTAYNVDKVVKELEDYQMWKGFMIYDLTHREREIIRKAIEIVKGGGVNEEERRTN